MIIAPSQLKGIRLRLSDYVSGRDNNFNLIRMAAAMAVLVTHSFAVAIGTAEAEPFRGRLGMTIGNIAVDVFFVTSGFLVSGSLLRRQNAWNFVRARLLRIFPGLFVMLLLVVYGAGAYLTSLPVNSYFANSQTHLHFLKSATLLTGVGWVLPGVFEQNPFREIVNGSLWTLPYECAMYGFLFLLWTGCRKFLGQRIETFNLPVLSITLLLGLALLLSRFGLVKGFDLVRFGYMFFVGATFYAFRNRIILSGWAVAVAGSAALLALLVGSRTAFFVIYAVTLAYTVLYLAYVPTGVLRQYNRVGDYSYGVYIYAFPIQQSIAALIVGVSVPAMLILSSTVTIFLAILSWHIVEGPALMLKGKSLGP